MNTSLSWRLTAPLRWLHGRKRPAPALPAPRRVGPELLSAETLSGRQ
jgi:hypothetical protein